MNQELQCINFYGSDLLTIERDGALYVAMKPVCESIGLQWEDQFKRIKRHPVLSEGISMMDIPSRGGNQITLMLTLKMLHGWLFLIDSSLAAPAVKDTVILYQKECFEVLSQYWQNKSTVRETGSSEAGCFNNLHVFLEVTRGRMNISQNGNQHNTVSMPTAQVLQYLYQHRTSDRAAISASASKLGKKLHIDRTTVSRSIIRLAKWDFLQRHSEPGKPLTVVLNEEVISDALEVSRLSLLSNQQRVGFLAWH